MGFERNHTFGMWPFKVRRQDPKERHSLNTDHAGILAWLLGQGLIHYGRLPCPPTVEEIADTGLTASMFQDFPPDCSQCTSAIDGHCTHIVLPKIKSARKQGGQVSVQLEDA